MHEATSAGRRASTILRDLPTSGNECALPPFMRPAGMSSHSTPSRSTSSRVWIPHTSPDRSPVRSTSSSASQAVRLCVPGSSQRAATRPPPHRSGAVRGPSPWSCRQWCDRRTRWRPPPRGKSVLPCRSHLLPRHSGHPGRSRSHRGNRLVRRLTRQCAGCDSPIRGDGMGQHAPHLGDALGFLLGATTPEMYCSTSQPTVCSVTSCLACAACSRSCFAAPAFPPGSVPAVRSSRAATHAAAAL